MKIITVNLPVNDIKMIKNLVGENGLYPSRSELIRVAIRDFLVKELKVAKNFTKFRDEHSSEDFLKKDIELDNKFVRKGSLKLLMWLYARGRDWASFASGISTLYLPSKLLALESS